MRIDLFGPVLTYELVRTGRKRATFLWRTVYALALLFFLAYSHQIWRWEHDIRSRFGGGQAAVTHRDLANLAATFFGVIAVTQFLAAVLPTPAYVAGTVARDKEQRILDFLLATDLSSREIVFGKLLGRVANVAVLLLAGLPVLAFVQFFGGVDPDLLLLTTAGTAATVAGVAGVSVLCSVLQRRARGAIALSYFAWVAYIFLSALALGVAEWIRAGGIPAWLPNPTWLPPWLDAFAAGNPLIVFMRIEMAQTRGVPLADAVWSFFWAYNCFHLLTFAGTVLLAIVILRRMANAHAGGPPVKRSRIRLWKRPPVSNQPVVWKEWYAEGLIKPGIIGRIFIGLIVLASFAPPLLIVIGAYYDDDLIPRAQPLSMDVIGEGMNVYTRFVSVCLGGLMLIAVAVRASGAVGGERDRDTLISLLTSPLSSREILAGKWLGSLASVRWLAAWWAVLAAISLAFGGLHPAAVPVVVASWLAPAAFAASLGLWFSTVCSTATRATVATLFAGLFCAGGHWMVTSMCCFAPIGLLGGANAGDLLELIVMAEAGLTPPFALGFTPFRQFDDLLDGPKRGVFVAMLALGVMVWASLAAVLFETTLERFRVIFNRAPDPRRPPPNRVQLNKPETA